MGVPTDQRIAFLSEALRFLAAPILIIATGLGTFIYEVGWGHDRGFAITGLVVALTAAGFSADVITRRLGG